LLFSRALAAKSRGKPMRMSAWRMIADPAFTA
jgi:hypothetical protein